MRISNDRQTRMGTAHHVAHTTITRIITTVGDHYRVTYKATRVSVLGGFQGIARSKSSISKPLPTRAAFSAPSAIRLSSSRLVIMLESSPCFRDLLRIRRRHGLPSGRASVEIPRKGNFVTKKLGNGGNRNFRPNLEIIARLVGVPLAFASWFCAALDLARLLLPVFLLLDVIGRTQDIVDYCQKNWSYANNFLFSRERK